MDTNQFIHINEIGEGKAFTENGAVSYASTGSELVNQFSKAGCFRGRAYEDVWLDQAKLWNENKTAAVRFPFYLRMITRKDNITGGRSTEKVQRGQGQRDEAFKRLLWLAVYHAEDFYRNLWLLPVVGCWKDLLTLAFMAETDTFPVDRVSIDTDKVYDLLIAGLADKDQKDLVKKYLPRIRSEKQCTTSRARFCNKFAKGLMKKLGLDAKGYRELKVSGLAHDFQKKITWGYYQNLDWSKIPGKALLNLVDGKFLEAHDLTESYIKWLEAQPVVKFNGYPYELMNTLTKRGNKLAKEFTVNKQFDNLIATAKADDGAISGNVLCCLDTSGSMTCPVGHGATTAFNVCMALGIYFSELNQGAFHNTVCMFDDESSLKRISGTFSEKVKQIGAAATAWGSTNFQSVIELICKTREKHPEIPLDEFPKTLLVVSDMQFNPAGGFLWDEEYSEEDMKTNNDEMLRKLREVFPSDFVDGMKFIWWNVAGRGEEFPSNVDKGGQYMFSGFDGAVISLLLGGDAPESKERPSMEEMVNQALDQEVLQLVALAD